MLREYERCRELVDSKLEECFLSDGIPHKGLAEAMRYSLLAGGKRIRPVLVLQFCRACGGDEERALPSACAVEMLHTYSLIHDDLPCMDDDDLRRGRPANHIVFGECTATLAGDALQAEAFSLLLSSALPADRVVRMAAYLAEAAGLSGICGGQALDIDGEGKDLGEGEISEIHRYKTAALLKACALIGVSAAGGTEEQIGSASRYAEALGLAFQIRDDVLDCTADEKQLGKTIGSDAGRDKSTFVSLYGVERCRELVRRKTEEAQRALTGCFDDCGFLVWLAGYLAERTA
ncbi:MAG: polyprenyl synthetase family protein [Oscillospiraceae bacterium]|nr:polyprenyl synthetase family protein [Oscillospiraceae bacterium]